MNESHLSEKTVSPLEEYKFQKKADVDDHLN